MWYGVWDMGNDQGAPQIEAAFLCLLLPAGLPPAHTGTVVMGKAGLPEPLLDPVTIGGSSYLSFHRITGTPQQGRI